MCHAPGNPREAKRTEHPLQVFTNNLSENKRWVDLVNNSLAAFLWIDMYLEMFDGISYREMYS